MALEESDMDWIGKLQIRRRDQRLKDDGGGLMTVQDADRDREENEGEKLHQGRSANDEPSMQIVKRLGWLEGIGLE